MRIGEVIKRKQPDVYFKLFIMRSNHSDDYYLKYEDFEKLMRHDSYKRFKGAIRQVRNG